MAEMGFIAGLRIEDFYPITSLACALIPNDYRFCVERPDKLWESILRHQRLATMPKPTQDSWGRPTRWTLIRRAAKAPDQNEVARAWEELVARYRDPVHRSVARVLGHHPAAEDIAEDFFAYLFSEGLLDKADASVGRFRCFIQGVIKRYARQQARKQQSRAVDLDDAAPPSVDSADAEEREEAEWALTILHNATQELMRRNPRDGELLLRASGIPPYAMSSRDDLCKRFNMKRNAINVAVHRARQILRELIESEIAETVDSADALAQEKKVMTDRLMDARPELYLESGIFFEWLDQKQEEAGG